MSNQHNIELVQRTYAAFGAADIPAILAGFAPDAEITFEGAVAGVPWHRRVQGHAQLPEFFAALGAEVEFETFEPLTFVADAGNVAVRLHLRYRVKRTGKMVDQYQIHWWTVRDGKLTAICHYEDTRQVAAACA